MQVTQRQIAAQHKKRLSNNEYSPKMKQIPLGSCAHITRSIQGKD